jgi:hypothetical protein
MKKILIIVFLCLFPFNYAGAVMRSDSYIIRENVDYAAAGPAISGAAASPGATGATITWTTSEAADSFVVYDTSSGFTASKEQGLTSMASASHSVTLAGLSSDTLYYYKIKSTNAAGGTTVSAASSFTTSSSSSAVSAASSGGLLIIDKNDKSAPVISSVKTEASYTSIIFSWNTDENSSSFIEYGTSDAYGHTYGKWNSVTAHAVTLTGLTSGTKYYFRILSGDSGGNLAVSEGAAIETLSRITEGMTEDEILEIKKMEELEKNLEEAGAIDSEIAAKEETLLDKLGIIEKLAGLLPDPFIVGEPRVRVDENSAIISWRSNKKTNAVVAYAPNSLYRAGAEEPYLQKVGDFENFGADHEIKLYGLEPNTLYNFQVRMKPLIGNEVRTANYSFKTLEEGLEISNYYVEVADLQKATFKWVTNNEADAAVKFSPYRGNVVSVEEAKIVKDDSYSVIHNITIDNILSGTVYNVQLMSRDKEGSLIVEEIKQFSTGTDDRPPVISQVQTNSTIYVDKEDRVQTLISWKTDEPSSSKVYHQQGVHREDSEWTGNTKPDASFAKNHVAVINDFKSGTVYSFRIEGEDASGNASLSKVFTFITPRQKQSVFNVIVNTFENIFGWMFG